ncbi:hypothetical protein FBY31_0325 [Arthrobacter sp. SLBN-100]|nr:hypothetical protein FBY31_0325 [Arthrobacter sp. SLBN-100]
MPPSARPLELPGSASDTHTEATAKWDVDEMTNMRVIAVEQENAKIICDIGHLGIVRRKRPGLR